MERLSSQEEEVMLRIWESGSCFIKDILLKYPEPQPPYTTIASIVKNLERKNYISSRRCGNTYEYAPLVKENEYKQMFMNNVIRNYFKDSYKEMVCFFARKDKISIDELKEIIEMIEKGKK